MTVETALITPTSAIAASARSRQLSIRQTIAMAKRSTIELARQPALIAPSMFFPIFFAVLSASSFSKTTSIPGFPKVESFMQFSLASTIVQGVLFGSVTGAAALATDIENGFFDRLLLAPTTRTGILLGRLAGSALFGFFQSAFFLAVLVPFDAPIAAGIPGALVMVLSGGIVSLAIGAIMSSVAIRTGSAEAVQGAFPLLFVLLFFSSAFFPRETMSGAYKRIADLNPISYLVEGLRALVLEGFTLSAVVRSLLVPTAICGAAILFALKELRRKLAAL
jgi:ABC-2 type transport system permease protein